MISPNITFALSAIVVFFTAQGIFAAPLVQFEVTAIVDYVNDPLDLLGGTIQQGETLKGLIQFDLALPDEDPSPSIGFYDGDPLSDNFISGANETNDFFVSDSFFDITVENDEFDRVDFFASGDTIPSTLAAPEVDFVDLQVLLFDEDGTALNDTALPTELNLDDYEVAVVFFSAEGGGINPEFVYEVEAFITSISSTFLLAPGDFDGDGDADGLDFLTWQKDPSVGALSDWQANYGMSFAPPVDVATVPEPAAVVILGFAIGLAATTRPTSNLLRLHRPIAGRDSSKMQRCPY